MFSLQHLEYMRDIIGELVPIHNGPIFSTQSELDERKNPFRLKKKKEAAKQTCMANKEKKVTS